MEINQSQWEIALYIVLLIALWIFAKLLMYVVSVLYKFFRNPTSEDNVDPYINGVKYPVSYWSEKGARPYQEDRYNAMRGTGCTQASLYGVFDGHGGHRAAEHCKDYLLQCIATDPDWDGNPAQSITKSFHKVDADFSLKARSQLLNDGSTAVVGIIDKEKIYVANAGDSRGIVVQRGGKVKPMSLDHRPERKDEESRIRKLGGKLIYWGRWRVEGVLAVSRSIGDVSLQPYVTCDPEIIEKKLEGDDEYLILASDGLWDVMDNEYVGKLVLNGAKTSFLTIAKTLCTEAIILGSADNVTAMVIDLKQRAIVTEAAKPSFDRK